MIILNYSNFMFLVKTYGIQLNHNHSFSWSLSGFVSESEESLL